MKNYSDSFLAAITSDVNCLCFCWRIKLANDEILGFTERDRPIIIDGITYEPDGGFWASDIDKNFRLDSSQVTVQSYFSAQLPQKLIASGQLRGAEVFIFRVNPLSLPTTLADDPLTYDPCIRGRLGKINLGDRGFQAEIQSLEAGLSTKAGAVIQASCRNDFCDVGGRPGSSCGLDIADYTDGRTVTVLGGNDQFFYFNESVPQNYYSGSNLIWQSGDNVGVETVVLYCDGSMVRTLDRPPFPIQVGDTFEVARACNKTLAFCAGLGNKANYNGEPALPGDRVKAVSVGVNNP